MARTAVFAAVPVRDFDAMTEWYARLLGGEPDMRPHDAEACWQLTETAWVYVLGDSDRSGGAEVTILVDDLDAELEGLSARGIEPDEVEEYTGKARKAIFSDPEGNRVGIAQPFG